MSLVIPPGFGLAAINFTGPNGTAPYVTTIGVGLSFAGGDFVGAANRVMAAYTSAFHNGWSSNLTLERVTLTVGSDGPSGSVDSDLDPVTSSRSTTFMPTACSAIARKVTAELGRRGRGRMFLPGVLADAEVDEAGQILPAQIDVINTSLATFLTELASDEVGDIGVPVTPVLLHSPHPSGSVPTPITSMTCVPVVGWIRGRIR